MADEDATAAKESAPESTAASVDGAAVEPVERSDADTAALAARGVLLVEQATTDVQGTFGPEARPDYTVEGGISLLNGRYVNANGEPVDADVVKAHEANQANQAEYINAMEEARVAAFMNDATAQTLARLIQR